MSRNVTNELYTRVKNTSGVARFFGYLPPHGVKLAAGAIFHIFGDLTLALTRGRRTAGRRSIEAFEKDLGDGVIALLQAPLPVIGSPNGNPNVLTVGNTGTVGSATPSWLGGTSASLSDAG
jgi:hypothetical protein